ncbi:MAG TPA: class I SAM-dependent methyltransferase [Solirubrobacterales bacterium]
MKSDACADGREAVPEREVRYRWAASILAGDTVLDAACGRGWGTARLASRAARTVGVDLSPGAIADARREHGDRAEFREGDLRQLPFGDDEFDSVVCFEAITHVADPGQALDELRRVLRAGGVLLISSPNRDAYPPGNPLHLSETSSAELEQLLHARFRNVAVYGQQTYVASLLADTAVPGRQNPDEPTSVKVTRAAAGPLGSEAHSVAVASDEELPPAPAWLAIGEEVDRQAQRRLLEEWQERAMQAEAEALALRKELRDLQS